MAMAAMGAGDPVAVVELQAEADRRGFLAGIEVNETRYLAGGEFRVHPILEFADRAHGGIGFEQIFPAELHATLPKRSNWPRWATVGFGLRFLIIWRRVP